jgi:hypothetical protein
MFEKPKYFKCGWGHKKKTMVLNVPTILVWDTQRNDTRRRIEMASLLHQTSWKS